MPADRLTLSVRVGRDVEGIGLLGGLFQLVQNLLLAWCNHVLRPEALLGIDPELGLRQIPYVAHRRLDGVGAVQILLDGLHLRRRLDDHQRTLGHYRLLDLVGTATHR